MARENPLAPGSGLFGRGSEGRGFFKALSDSALCQKTPSRETCVSPRGRVRVTAMFGASRAHAGPEKYTGASCLQRVDGLLNEVDVRSA